MNLCSAPSELERNDTLPRKPNFAHYLREARIKRRLSVAEVAERLGVEHGEHLFLGNGPRSGPARSKMSRALQGTETADQGDAGVGSGLMYTLELNSPSAAVVAWGPTTAAAKIPSKLFGPARWR